MTFSASGRILAAGGDDGEIKVISLDSEKKKVFRTIPSSSSGHSPYVRGLSYDPEDSYLAVISADGTFSVYDVTNGKMQITKKKCATHIDPTDPHRITPAWHPDGSLIAVPKNDGSIAVYEKLSWSIQYELRAEDGVESKMHIVTFSPNGLYIAAVAEDRTVRVWSTNESEKEILCSHTLDDQICNIVWHPFDNALLCMTEGGNVAVWNNVIPLGTHLGPAEKVELDDPLKNRHENFQDGEINNEAIGYESDEDKDDSFIEDDENSPRPKRKSIRDDGAFQKKTRHAMSQAFEMVQQAAFQPGATDAVHGRRYLAYNSLGCIILRSEADHNIVEVSFHDTSLHRKRIPLLNDFYGFSVGSLGRTGALYASPSSDHAPSTVVFRPFESWATNSEWTVPLPKNEEAIGVAVGDIFCIVGTNQRMLRIFSISGLQVSIMSTPGNIVCVFAEGDVFGVVYHAGSPTVNGDQNLAVKTYSFSSGQILMETQLCMSHLAHLMWIGFTDENAVATYDSEGILRAYSPDFGGSWIPIFDSSKERKGSESFWLFAVSIISNEAQCIVCADSLEPIVPSGSARPVVTAPPLHLPLIQNDVKLSTYEKTMVRMRILLSQLDPQANSDLVSECHLDHDKAGLSLIKGLLEQDKAAMAFEVAERMFTSKALEGALRIANHFNINALVDRIEELISERNSAELVQGEDDPSTWIHQNYSEYQDSEPGLQDVEDFTTEQTIPLENGEPNRTESHPFTRKVANPFARRKA